jgi:hypothetical protein
MKKYLIIGLLLLVTIATAHAASFREGDWVLARYKGDQFWFPGVVRNAGDGVVTVAYDDGDRETLPERHVKPYDWRVGSRVECQWQGGNEWFAGKITEIGADGTTLRIAYDDGDRERTKTSSCRAR